MGIQVQSATKNRQGQALSVLKRQFISFSYGGKNIEDFDLLVVFSNDRLDKEVYASFNDITTEQAELDGQLYWRTNFKAGRLNFILATDGMTAKQLEDFKKWFEPGTSKELILTEHSNRAIMARISAPPRISLLPFEHKDKINIGNSFYEVTTSLYKGEINLEFVMDDPYWYSKTGVIKSQNFTPEELKIIYEDGIPSSNMFSASSIIFLGKDNYYDSSDSQVKTNSLGLSFTNGSNKYLYYCGTAPSYPIFSFDVTLSFFSDKVFYSTGQDNFEISFGSNDKGNYNKMVITLPSRLSSYNKAIEIIDEVKTGDSVYSIRAALRDSITNYYTRNFTMGVIDFLKDSPSYVNSSSGTITGSFASEFKTKMKKFFGENSDNFIYNYMINCQTGEVTISGKYGYFENKNSIVYVDNEIDSQENAGNMIKSGYLSIKERNLPNQGIISINDCLMLNSTLSLNNFKIIYNYMYY